jgi:hypothetical protein
MRWGASSIKSCDTHFRGFVPHLLGGYTALTDSSPRLGPFDNEQLVTPRS